MRWRAATAVAAAAVAGAGAAAGTPAQAAPTAVLVAVTPGAAGHAALASTGHGTLVSRALGVWRVRVPRGESAVGFARSLARRRGVVVAQPDYHLHAAAPTLACMPAPGNPDGWFVSAVRANASAPPASTAPVAVLDSGVDGSLPEFAGRIASPFNAISGGSDASDGDGHGTGVAGVAAASPGAMRGISPTSPVMPVKVLGPDGGTDVSTLVTGIDAAVAAHAAVINISAAGSVNDTSAAEDRVMEMAIGRAFLAGTLVVAPTGNEGTNGLDLPSAYPHVLSVAATDSLGQVTDYSNGGESVDLAAPGDGIVTTAPASLCATHFALASGTSFAAPAVSAAVALVKAARPQLSPSELFALVRSSARDIGPRGFDTSSGFGLLDVSAALTAGTPPADGPEVDDEVYWVTGRYAARHPFQLSSRRRSARMRGTVNAYNDPADVYRVKLRKGDRLSLKLSAPSGTRYVLSVWSSRTHGFDISGDRERGRLVAVADRRGARESLRAKARRGGVYYLAVSAPRPDSTLGSYVLTARRKPS